MPSPIATSNNRAGKSVTFRQRLRVLPETCGRFETYIWPEVFTGNLFTTAMLGLNPATVVLVVALGLFTAVAASWDIRWRRIPNFLTLPMFGAGILFQLTMSFLYGWHNFASAAGGFLVGFGVLFLLWFVGGGGGGDVKLMGAISVWLGFRLTLAVMIVSTLLVLLVTMGVVVWSVVFRGVRGTRQQYLATGKTPAGQSPRPESVSQKQGRRLMAYATPIAIATWVVVLWKLPAVDKMWHPAQPAAAVVQQQNLNGNGG